MKERPGLAISVVANVVLFGTLLAVVGHSTQESASILPVRRPASEALFSTDSWQRPQASVRASDLGTFHWADIRTNDYGALMAQLRAIGCPETTIQDVVAGYLNRQYNSKIIALRKASSRFWETQQRRSKATFEDDMTREREARGLEQEKSQVMQELLGISFPDYLAECTGRPDRHSDLTDQIAPESRQRAGEVLRKYDQLERELIERGNGTLGKPELDELRQAYYQQHAELKEFLSPSEMEEFEVRTSPIAQELRDRDLVGFSPTEEEFRAIFRVRKAFEESSNGDLQSNTETQLAGIVETRRSMEDRLRETLGEKRFADYERAQDFAYRGLVEIADHFGLSTEPAIQVHDLRLATLKEVERLSADPNSDMETRRSELQRLQTQVQQNVALALGDEAFHAYIRSSAGRGWLERISDWTNGVVLRP